MRKIKTSYCMQGKCLLLHNNNLEFMLVPSLLQHCGDTHKSLVGVGTNEGGGEGKPPPPLNEVSSSSPSAAWTGITPAGKPTNSEIQQPAHVLSLEDRQHVDIFGHVL